MPIRAILSEHIEQECYPCGAIRELPLTSFAAGVQRGPQVSGQLMQLPACAGCGAVEFLVASSEKDAGEVAAGSFSHKHRLLVDALYARMVRAGRHLEDLEPATLRTAEPPPDELAQWFPAGLRLERAPEVLP
ncbi:hypothetical protein [Haliangium ochraceum]|uniref:Uncharacterized protein n=1 Tax=Haliangium ochraceum (strain DSM 14365 / JCM 11303 / SMP-2) TaxID=502025 RepID=D0LPA8_HALO1|nr:hypothetical protein [Haliangium ochraceum]ACY13473.1 conserved hypothetical protein [Haliangium ochraceum DSM 14365]